jgi:4-aminobutyrate aminotransferase-like enzyme/Ser/Thr protein kinase RdoA (MazF antagonist)
VIGKVMKAQGMTQTQIFLRDTDQAAAWLNEAYGLGGRLTALPGEHDANFKLQLADGRRYLFKIHAQHLSDDEVMLQADTLAYLAAAAPDLPMQRLIPAKTGALLPLIRTSGAVPLRLRLTSWIEGEVWGHHDWVGDASHGDYRRRRASQSLGELLGRLDLALAGFNHPAAERFYLWDLAVAGAHEAHLSLIDDSEKRAAVTTILARFKNELLPRLARLPKQLIHNDANDYNLLIDAEGGIAGLIDFGDMVSSWRINEIAVAAAYAMIGSADPIAIAGAIAAGYHAVNPLSDDEIDCLFDLILTRYAVSIAMAAKQIRDNPDNRYLLISQADVWLELRRHLGGNAAHQRRVAQLRLREACGFEPVATRRQVTDFLARQTYTLGPVFRRSLERQTLIELDLGEETLVAAGFEPQQDHKAIASYMAAQARAHPDHVLVAAYGEARPIYRNAAYVPPARLERRNIHLGIDLIAPVGETVLAPLTGLVEAIGNDPDEFGWGGVLLLRHETDAGVPFWSIYGHLAPASLAALKIGQKLITGDPIGRLGETSENGDWPAHLHLQLLTDLCGWEIEDIAGIVAPSQWRVWRSVSPDPNLLLRLPINASRIVASEPEQLLARRQRVLGKALSLAYRQPLKIVRGEGCHLYDDGGRAYLDMVNNVCHVGHCHPRVVAAGQRQMAQLNTNTRYLHDTIIEYLERLAETLPPELSCIYLVNSGSEANDLALRLARAYTGNRDVVTVDHAYHGHVTSLIGVSPYKFNGRGGEGCPDDVWVAEMPDLYRGRWRSDEPRAGDYYAASVQACIEQMAQRHRRPAVMFSEAILGTGGQLTLPADYLRQAYAHIRAAGGICIADEVQIGFGRVGSHMWAFETQNVIPDIVTMGKPIANGHPMAAVATRPEIAAAFANGMEYFNTFGGNPVSSAMALAVLDVIRDERLMQNAASIGKRMTDGLRKLATRHDIIGDVRGQGLFLGVELVRDRRTLEPAAAELSRLVEAMKRRQVLLSTEGPHHNVLKIKPPIVFGADHCDEFLDKLDLSLSEL